MRTPPRLAAVVATTCLLTAACTSDDAEPDEPATATADDATDDGDGPDDADDDGGDEPEGPTSIDLDETEDHPNGSTMTVTGLELDDNGIFVSFELYNGHNQTLTMALYGEDDRVQQFVQLVDDTGRSYAYQGPSDNPSLELEPNNDMSARVGFLGRLPADATSVTLRFNYNEGLDRPVHGGSSARNTPHPTFVFEDLPLPGR